MAKTAQKSIFFLLGLVMFGTVCSVGEGGWREKFSSVGQYGKDTLAWCGGHQELVELIGCLAQVPSILTTNSESNAAVKASALLAMLGTDTKVLHELFRTQNGCLAATCVYDLPKTVLYGLASVYDYLRLTGTVRAVPASSPEARYLRLFKMTQFFQLGVEALLRVLAFMDTFGHDAKAVRGSSKYLSEVADWVAAWRLVSRFGVLSDQDTTFDGRLENAKKKSAEMLTGLSSDLTTRSSYLSGFDIIFDQPSASSQSIPAKP